MGESTPTPAQDHFWGARLGAFGTTTPWGCWAPPSVPWDPDVPWGHHSRELLPISPSSS